MKFYWKDVPKKRFTMAGQTYPEPSPYDLFDSGSAGTLRRGSGGDCGG